MPWVRSRLVRAMSRARCRGVDGVGDGGQHVHDHVGGGRHDGAPNGGRVQSVGRHHLGVGQPGQGAGQAGHLVAGSGQDRDGLAANDAGGAGQQDTHGGAPLQWGRR